MNNEDQFKNRLKDLLNEQDFPYDAGNWEKASAALDKEDERKRRFLFFLFSGIGLGLMILGFIFYKHNSTTANKTKEKVKEKKKTMALATSSHSESANKTNNQPVPVQAESISNPNSSENKPNASKPILSAKSISTKQSESSTQSNIKNNKSDYTTTPTKNNVKDSTVNSNPSTVRSTFSGGLNSSKTTKKAIGKESPSPVSKLPDTTLVTKQATIAATEVMPETKQKATEEPENVAVTNSVEPQAPVTANTTTEAATPPIVKDTISVANTPVPPKNIQKSSYFFAEAGSNINFGWKAKLETEGRGFNPYAGIGYLSSVSQKISMSLGVYYSSMAYFSQNSKSSANEKSAFALTASETAVNPSYPGQGLVLVYGQTKDVTQITPTTLQYLSIPARLLYLINNNQSLTLGYTFSYLLDVRSKVETYTQGYNTISNYTAYKTQGYKDGFTPFASQISLGYRKRIYRQLWFNGEVLLGLSDLRDNVFFGIDKYERASGITIGLTYNFVKK